MATLNVDFEFAEKYKPFVDDFIKSGHTRYSLYGGRDSGKSTAAYMLIVLVALTEGSVMIARRYKTNIKGSSFNGIAKIIKKYKLQDYFVIPKAKLQITCKINGNTIDFAGLDSFDKLKSGETQEGNYRLLVFEESQEISSRSICDEVISCYERGENSDGFRVLWIFNPPPNRKHWLNLELRQSDEKHGLMALKVNYTDIPEKWVGKQQLKEINRIKEINHNLYRYRYLGEAIPVEDVIFENVRVERITDEQIATWIANDRCLFVGMDYGYSPDPNAANMCYYDIQNRLLYIFKEYHSYKQNNQQISDGLERAGFSKDYIITCDNDEKTIRDLNAFGWHAIAAKKHNLRDIGFSWLQCLNGIIIDGIRCPYTAEEFVNYHYITNKDGVVKSMYPEGQADHHIADIRYAVEKLYMKAGV